MTATSPVSPSGTSHTAPPRRAAAMALVSCLALLISASNSTAWTWGTTNRFWSTGDKICSSPAIGSDGTVYIGSRDNNLYAFNPDGSTNRIWSTGGDVDSSPAIGPDDVIYVGSWDNKLYAFNPDGSTNMIWTTGNAVLSSPAIGLDGTIYVGSYDGKLYAFNPDGSTNRTWTTGGPIDSSPTIGTDGAIYIGSSDTKLYAFNPDGSTNKIWPTAGDIFSCVPAIGSDGTVYIGSRDTKLYGFNPDGSTNRIWSTGNKIYNSPAIGSDGTIYIGSSDTKLYAFNPDGTTNRVWSTGNASPDSPVIGSDGTIYIGSDDNKLYAFNPDGTTNRVWSTGNAIWSSPTIAPDGTVYIGSTDHNLYAFDGTGETLADTPWPKCHHDLRNSGLELRAPTGLTAADGNASDKISVNWTAAANATGYSIRRNTSNHSGSATSVGSSTTNLYDDTSATPCTVYYYWARATNYAAVSMISTSDSGWRALPVPTDVNASDGTYTAKVAVCWNPVAGATSYAVYRSTGNDSSSSTNLTETASVSHNDTSMAEGITNYYWVRALCSISTSDFSAVDGGYALETLTTPAAPTEVSASDGTYTGMVHLSWTASVGATIYEVWSCTTNSSCPATNIAETSGSSSLKPGQLSWNDTNVMADVTNYYWLKAVNSAGASAFSVGDSGYAASFQLDAPTGVVASDGTYADKVRIEWNSVTNATSYEVWRSTSSSPSAATQITSQSSNEYNDTSALPIQAYYYWIKAANSSTTSDFSSADNGYRRSSTDGDYSGNGSTDMAVYNPATGNWHIRDTAGNIVATIDAWGGPDYAAICGDYDNDGLNDIAVYDTTTGKWYIRTVSGTTILYGEQHGGPGYTPVPGDYNGDGTSDLAVYDTATGYWYVREVGGTVIMTATLWGGPTYTPVPGNYNGDGVADLAVYDESTGIWYIKTVDHGTIRATVLVDGVQWGGPGLTPVPGDYDGDRSDDMAVYEQSSGKWYIRSIAGTAIADGAQWGGAGYTPLNGDYNGDGTSDLAVYDISTGKWYVETVSGGSVVDGEQWGGAGYEPTTQTDGTSRPAGLTAAYRFYSYGDGESTYEHIFTACIDEASMLNYMRSWSYECVCWYALPTQSGSATALYRLYNASTKVHCWTTDASKYNSMVADGWTGEGTRSYVWATSGGGRLPVYQFHNPALGAYLYTANEIEWTTLLSNTTLGYTCQGIAFYVYSGP